MKKIYKILLLIIIPLLIAAGISVYSYSRYKTSFFGYYMNQSEYKNTEDRIDRYVKFYSSYYDVWYEEDVKDAEGKALFTLRIYRWFDVDVTEDDNGDEITTKSMKYLYALYNINYGNVFYTMYDRADKNNRFEGYLPTFSLVLTDKADEDRTTTIEFASKTDCTFEDYNYVGYTNDDGVETKKYYSGAKISADTSVRFATVSVDTTYTVNLNVVITSTDSKDTEVDIDSFEHDFTDYYTNAKKLDIDTKSYMSKTISVGYDEDIADAGYAKFVITKYIWWEALIAIVLTLVVTGSTVAVWESEASKEAEKQAKIKK